MRNALATRNTPGRVEVEDQDLVFVVRENCSLPVCLLPPHIDDRVAAQWGHRKGRFWRSRDDGRLRRRVGAVTRSACEEAKKSKNQGHRSTRIKTDQIRIHPCRSVVKSLHARGSHESLRSLKFISRCSFVLFLGKSFTGHTILTFDPATEVD
jgi:hypothetical protein